MDISNRTKDWLRFSSHVASHIENYTVKQYGDAPNDQLEGWTPEQCLEAIKRYYERNIKGTNARGPIETLRDMIKIAHYAQVAYDKLIERMRLENASKPD
jgi:hypothetical protein